ncbi:uncharacterized protein LOC141644171 [Silene latifolia]|uniref:uncharacterized protein LOC141644171 n=1 Tax=Silene latifolia TaxID=37657 RepID=UPI003D76FF36
MVGTKVLEEVASEKYFDQIDDLLDFQNDDVEDGGLWDCENFDVDSFPPVWLEESSALPSTGCNNQTPDFSVDRYTAPYDDTLQLEWVSNLFQDSLSKPNTFPVCHAKRARSKRPRPATFNPRSAIHLTPPSYFPVSQPLKKRPGQPKKKQKIESYGQSNKQNEHPNAYPPRKCTHCEITETPQWRMGPAGPKTLCNACGVRYKSGRLLPEYRPAASPTFVPSLHSNSHRKIVEMRKSKNENETVQPDLFEKSDRLFSEYSPAASLTFVPSVNSNSPRKAVEMRNSKNENETIQLAPFQKSDSLFPECSPATSPTFVPPVNSNSPRKAVDMRKRKNENETIQLALFEKSDSLFPECSPATSPTFIPSVNSNSPWKAVEMMKSKNENKTIQPALLEKSDSLFPECIPATSPTFVPSVNLNSSRKTVEMRKCKNENETIQPAPFDKSDSLYPECSPATSPTFLPSLHSNFHQKVVETRRIRENEDETIQPDLFHKSSSYEKSLDISKCTSMVEVPVMIDLTYLPDLIPGSVIVID